MAKTNFLLVDLNESKTKKLAETITSDTSRKILNFLTEKEDSEQNIAKSLNIPISTVHYHLQKLQEAGLVVVEEYHYSQKGREINHYKLANKYIIIAPKKVSGLREKLKGILPVSLVILGISAVMKVASTATFARDPVMQASPMAEAAVDSLAMMEPQMAKAVESSVVSSQPDIAFWFLLGGAAAIVLLAVYQLIMAKLRK
ncbi:hypothetical protein COV20_05745 [Candidatus Woesearchaeota archaeon CG10_big_fil_rev_8_21_14_0_10_45_16]|nr:MAG: hypothetical protein COV20_05745 [Candidatus Woesearchaeota archaeon CG10_big_fil_rev_8_21_14_0_10_45_16]